ncbi:LpqB family beta-propeller domain-containing protein [Gordonia sp. CPCC 205333]|uniref:LpqB family beta-propeller domain-containing protein n=1 Tax=Gordonia sp. CPCC 205333 TaxID=3140790 RepID=UPI003AF35835
MTFRSTVLRLVIGCAVVVLGLSGCASIPTDSAPQPVQPFNRQVPTSALPTPQNDMDPEALARAFLRATADPRNAHASARAFLTPTAAKQWDDRGDTVVLDDASLLVDERTDTSVTMRLIADNSGILKVNGQLLPANGRVETTMTMTRTTAGWRIDGALPSGVMLDRRQFESTYRLAMLYFTDPPAALSGAGNARLTPDPRWFYLGNYMPTDLLSRLIAGPTSELDGAVESSFPSGARLNGRAQVIRGAGMKVDFGGLGEMSGSARNLLAAQVIWTLHDADVAGPYTLTADGGPLVPGHSDEWRITDVESSNPNAVQQTSVGLNVLRAGALYTINDQGASPVAGPLGTDRHLMAAAISADGTRVAAVQQSADSPRVTLLAGAYGGTVSPLASGATISRPSFGPNNYTVWAVVDGKPTQWVFADSGTRVTVADASSIATVLRGPIAQLKVSPDGARAALLVSGQLLFASIVTSPDGSIALTSPRIAAYNLGNDSTGIDWATPTTLMVARDTPEAPVAQVSISGLPAVGLLSGNLTPPLRSVAANATTVYVGDARGVLRLGSTDGQPDRSWTEVDGAMSPDAMPVLPG